MRRAALTSSNSVDSIQPAFAARLRLDFGGGGKALPGGLKLNADWKRRVRAEPLQTQAIRRFQEELPDLGNVLLVVDCDFLSEDPEDFVAEIPKRKRIHLPQIRIYGVHLLHLPEVKIEGRRQVSFESGDPERLRFVSRWISGERLELESWCPGQIPSGGGDA